MADKIVTLKDKNNNNLYPVAGALFTDAVSTQSIQDSAVTSSKIDFTTIPRFFNKTSGYAIDEVMTGENYKYNVGHYDITTAGEYLVAVSSQTGVPPTSMSFGIRVYKNNTTLVDTITSTTRSDNYGFVSLTSTLSVNAGDTLDILVATSSAVPANASNQSYVSIVKIG